ncbi:MAG: hypothetical protein HYY62_00220 [Deltaproteobacteria bacterium]|nr:hypothetical protein [Deltaproteobacteria bacterium]
MKQTFVLILGFLLFLPASLFSAQIWHTASGKSYPIYLSLKASQKGSQSTVYVLSYKTKKNIHDQFGLVLEYYDLLSHFYYFHLPENLKNDKKSFVIVEAFKKLPKSKGEKVPARQFRKKISELKKIVAANDQIDANRLKAFQALNQKKWQEAIVSFKKIKTKVPHDYAQIANSYLRLQKKDEANKTLEAGVKQFPKDVTLLNNLAMTTLFEGTYNLEGKLEYDPQKMEEAKKILIKAREQNPKSWLTASNMATLEMTLQHPKEAEKFHLEALKLSGNNPRLIYQVATFYHGQKEFEKAKSYYEQALSTLKEKRSPAATKKRDEIQKRLKLAEEKKVP